MTDKGLIYKTCLNIPPFFREKGRLSLEGEAETRRIASVKKCMLKG